MLLEIITFILSLIVVFSLYVRNKYNYWKSRGIVSVPGKFPFGSLKPCLLLQQNVSDTLAEMYRKYEGKKYVGFYGPLDAFLLIRDPEMIRIILSKEFTSFHDQAFTSSRSVDPLLAYNPFGCRGYDVWKNARGVLSPALTISKLKLMVNDFVNAAENLNKYIGTKIGEPLEMKAVTSKYLADAVVSAAYGVESDSFFSSSPPFHTKGDLFVDNNEANYAAMSALFMPIVGKLFRWRTLSKSLESKFIDLSNTGSEHRKKNKISRPDVLQHLINLNDKAIQENRKPFSELLMAVYTVAIYGDGVDTTGLMGEGVFYFLAKESEVQEKLRQEILNVVQDLKDLDLDKLNSIEYLDMIISEALRLHSPIGILGRTCTKTVKIDDLMIYEGTKVFIPIYAIHMDEKYYPEPEKFIPERFSKENRNDIHKFTFLPFGEGPRMCMGFRMAQIEMKVALVAILLKYRMRLAKSAPNHLEKDTSSIFLTTAKGNIDVIFTPL
ncbi:hypothetical protein O3M35_006892 [Rhynocoris fuscipes]|uniref:Cytochrome P450 n=1 Tax=Rhynocoris fuscipes TaxID=488301 RepID=A0AAW1DHK3_9HEMI